MIRIYRNNEEGTAIVEHVEMTRAELDAALSVARETAYREAAAQDNRPGYTDMFEWCTEQADAEARKRGEG